MRILLLAAATLAIASAQRVLLVSIDALGHKNFTQSPAAKELRTLHALGQRGFVGPLRNAYPSKTATGHAALFTGVWSGQSGIFSNTTPRLPRAEHALSDTVSGYRSDSLAVEPLWTTASRHGIRAVAYQAPQLYPFTNRSAGLDQKVPPAVMNGYQSKILAPQRVVHQSDLKPDASGALIWTDGPLRFEITRTAAGLTIRSATGMVTVAADPLETAPPRGRALARHFSAMLPVEAEGVRSGVYFRLFEYSPTDFLLFRTAAHELAARNVPDGILEGAGAFVGNAPNGLYERGAFGKSIFEGGDGTAERRCLEGLELVVRQQTAQMIWLDKMVKPRLFVGYYPVIDDAEHTWFGLSATGHKEVDPYRAWAYAALDEGLRPLMDRFRSGATVFTSDHGMAAATAEIRMGTLLSDLGYAKETVVPNATCLYLNTADWKGGSVPLARRSEALAELQQKLQANPLFVKFYRGPDLEPFGLAGAGSPDLCYDVAPLYYPTESTRTPAVNAYPHAKGEHGFDPTREEMQAVFIAGGSRARQWLKRLPVRLQIDVVPYVKTVLGIDDPRN